MMIRHMWVILWGAALVLMPLICARLHRENEMKKKQLRDELAACFSSTIFTEDDMSGEEGSEII